MLIRHFKLGWYSRLVIVIAVTWTLIVGFVWYREILGNSIQSERQLYDACIETGATWEGIAPGDRLACEAYAAPADGPLEMWFYSTVAAGLYALFGAVAAAILYGSVRWILRGRNDGGDV